MKNTKALIFLLLLFISITGFSAVRTWTRTVGGSWTAASSWSLGNIPAANDDVIIPALTSTSTVISNVPQITLNSLTFSGSGGSFMQTATSGNVLTIRNSMLVPSTYSVTMGASGNRIVVTLSTTCTATLNGYLFFDAGNTNRNFTVNGTLIVNSTGGLIDPNPTGGSDFFLTNGATLRTQKPQGITTTAAPNSAGINYNVAVCFGGSYSYASGANYEYNGTAGQTTGAGLNQNTPNSVTVNLSAGDLTLTANTTISGTLNLNSGNVDLEGRRLTLGTSAAATGTLVRTAGYLYDGDFRRYFATTALAMPSTAGLFPMGTYSAAYRPLWVGYTSNLTTGGYINVVHTPTHPAWYVVANHVDASWSNTVVGVSNSLWAITLNAVNFNGTTAQIRYGGTGYGTNTLTDLNASLVSSVTGSHSATTNANTTYEVNRINLDETIIVNSWRIGSRNIANSPLPIELIDFEAKYADGKVHLYWSTSSEKNSTYFVVEKSENAIDFVPIETIDAAGFSSTQQNYFCYDKNPDDCYNYYRLKQVDLDGKYEYSKTVVICINDRNNEIFTVHPNPSSGGVEIVSAHLKDVQKIEVINAQGKKVYSASIVVSDLESYIDLSVYPSGLYYLNVYLADQVISKKIYLIH